MSVALRYLLDTNVLSETRRTKPDERVMSFLSGVEGSALYLSALTLGELRKGIALKQRSDGNAAKKLGAWVDGLEYSFDGHVLGIDAQIARVWGELSAERPRPVVDTLLAATAIVHDLTLVTRNTTDVRGIKVKLLNPWVRG